MRILVANDGLSDVGGVQSYLDCVLSGLAARGHAIAIVHCSDSGRPEVSAANRQFESFTFDSGPSSTFATLRTWAPDVCFSHNINDLSLERSLLDAFPVVKFMHGYFGTCVGGQKMHAFPTPVPCERSIRSGMPCALSAAPLLPLGSHDAGHLLAMDRPPSTSSSPPIRRLSWRAATCEPSSHATASSRIGSW